MSDELVDKVGYGDSYVDEEREALVIEDVGGDDAKPADYYRPRGNDDFDKEDYVYAVAGKLVAGDTDVGGNIMKTEDGTFRPMDYDMAGADLKSDDDDLYDGKGVFGDKNGVYDKTTSYLRSDRYEFTVTEADLQSAAEDIATDIDTNTLEEEIASANHMTERHGDRDFGQRVINNIEAFRNGELRVQ
jgi:hypothetical protein